LDAGGYFEQITSGRKRDSLKMVAKKESAAAGKAGLKCRNRLLTRHGQGRNGLITGSGRFLDTEIVPSDE
jgi:hypothetical protein